MSEALKATPRVRSIQRAALAMLVVAGVINYIDRATLAVANLTDPSRSRPVDRGHAATFCPPSCGPMRFRNCRPARWSTSSGRAFC